MELNKPNDSEFEQYQIAKKQVEELKGFYSHLASFILVNGILMLINFRYSPNHLFFFWTFGSWGIGLLFHAIRVFNWIPFFGQNWEERKIQQYIKEENSKTNTYE